MFCSKPCRGRQGTISTKKVKNNLLAAVLILTVVPSYAKVGISLVEHCCFLISQKLLDADHVRTCLLIRRVPAPLRYRCR